MRNWPTVSLGDVVDLLAGFPFKSARFQESPKNGVALVKGENVSQGRILWSVSKYWPEREYDEFSKYHLVPGDVVIAMDRPWVPAGLKWAFIRNDDPRALLVQRCARLRSKSGELDQQFLRFLIGGPLFERYIRPITTGVNVPHISGAQILAFKFPLPPLAIQRRIASILSAYDDLIENCERRIRVLDEMARALYREIFLADPQSERVSAQQLIDSGVLEINDGYRAKNSELGPEGLPFARAGNINAGFHFTDADLLAEENVPKAGSKVSRPGDIVFTSKGTVGRFAKVREGTPRFVYSPQLCFWRTLKPEVLSSNFLYQWMQSREFLDQVDQVKGSTDMADYVSLTNQRRMMVRVPGREALRRGEVALAPIDELIGNLTAQKENLRQTRDLLLPRLLSGQLSVEDMG